jgi:hypothetical protein
MGNKCSPGPGILNIKEKQRRLKIKKTLRELKQELANAMKDENG